jgi:large subunit ribosomal protein L7/L12
MADEITTANLAEYLGNLSILQVIELTRHLEERWGVSAAPQVIEAPVVINVPVVEEQTEFTVTLTQVGERKIEVIKATRAITLLGLGDAKAFVESSPKVVKEGVSRAEADTIRDQLVAAGATVEVK